MAVTSCRIQYAAQTYRATSKYEETIPVEWLIETNSRTDGPKYIVQAAQSVGPEPLPKQFDEYNISGDYDPNILARDIDLRRKEGADKVWIATVTYDNRLDVNQAGSSPFDRAPIDEWGTEQFQRVVEKDIDDVAITNSADVPYDPPLMADDSRPYLIYTRNEPSYPTAILTYQDCINSDQFLVFPPYTAKVNISATKMFESGVTYYQVRYVFQFRYDTWRRSILNQGYKFHPTTGTDVLMSIPAGNPPIRLGEDGTPLADDADSTFKTHKVYREVPFAPLNIVIY